ncbi:MAG: Gp37 family protein [Edaphocola sp.]
MNYEAIENELAARLNTHEGFAAVASAVVLPDAPADYRTPQQKGLVTVVFEGEKPGGNQSVGEASHHVTLTFNVVVQARLLRGQYGVYAISELVKASLVGYRPQDCGSMMYAKHSFGGYQNDIWEHDITFACTSLRVQDLDFPLPGEQVADEEIYYDPTKLTTDENIQIPGQE